MEDIIIAGAGGFGMEALATIQDINRKRMRWNIKGFINDIPDVLEGKKCTYGIIGTIIDWQPSENEVFVVGISSPAGKEKVANILKSKGAKFATLISPFALASPDADYGEGSIVTGGSIVSGGAKIGNFVHISGSMIGGGSTIGDYSTTTGYANVADACLGKRVFVGSHAVILNNLKVGDDAFVCAGSIVIRNVKPGTKVFGNPAKRIDI